MGKKITMDFFFSLIILPACCILFSIFAENIQKRKKESIHLFLLGSMVLINTVAVSHQTVWKAVIALI